jgi:hypothetical protein
MEKRFLAIIIISLLLSPFLSSSSEATSSPIKGGTSVENNQQKKSSLERKASSPSPVSNNSSTGNSNGQDRNNTFLDKISGKISDIAAALFFAISAYVTLTLERSKQKHEKELKDIRKETREQILEEELQKPALRYPLC